MSVIKCLANTCALLLAGAAAVADPLGHETGEVDLQLVLAADRSGSMSRPLVEAQRNGFAAAFRTDELQNAILSGPLGRIAVVYFEWSDHSDQEVVVPWTILADADDIHHFARELERAAPPEKGGETSISGDSTSPTVSFHPLVICPAGRSSMCRAMAETLKVLL